MLFTDLSQKLNALSERHGRHELQSLTMARVAQVGVCPAFVVDAATDIVSVVRRFTAERISHVLVRETSLQPSGWASLPRPVCGRPSCRACRWTPCQWALWPAQALADAAAQITPVIGLMHRGGTKASLIARRCKR